MLSCYFYTNGFMYQPYTVVTVLVDRCLESNAYNHVTATYFLLAERLLKKRNNAVSHAHRHQTHADRLSSPKKTALAHIRPVTYVMPLGKISFYIDVVVFLF